MLPLAVPADPLLADPLTVALSYAFRHWPVLPLTPRGKTPLGTLAPNGLRNATLNESVIRAWWAEEPSANIGRRTGAASGLVVVDLDGDEGQQAFIDRCGGQLPRTTLVKTGRGMQAYFAHPGHPVSNRAGVLPQVDIRGDGGYVVAPGSIHPNGTVYEWLVTPEEAPLAPLPEWLLTTLHSAPATPASLTPEPIVNGHRNDTLYPRARALRPRRLTAQAIKGGV